MEVVARDLLLLAVATDWSAPLRVRAHMWLEIFGNAKVQVRPRLPPARLASPSPRNPEPVNPNPGGLGSGAHRPIHCGQGAGAGGAHLRERGRHAAGRCGRVHAQVQAQGRAGEHLQVMGGARPLRWCALPPPARLGGGGGGATSHLIPSAPSCPPEPQWTRCGSSAYATTTASATTFAATCSTTTTRCACGRWLRLCTSSTTGPGAKRGLPSSLATRPTPCPTAPWPPMRR